ncbi:predicted protein [Uncinocarpus reesii 1704]|uniref:F-box domain-containing protein n=1 Tax=Uncinocarpus reesii (strain UAMH 1704) TaxID=336963 RepID=C4JHV5_UNCRE|nr:uncharacterized protein UREG_02791 [Uncinocarpus reesii 1704]EEP77942.1 predicted protein [Uncinocarpus reesii 1704]
MPTLTDLPLELLYAVVAVVAPRRSRYTADLYYSPDWASINDLSCLARTCKALHHVAQRELYRYPEARYRKIISLVRTLIKQPALAASVKELRTGDIWTLVDAPYPDFNDCKITVEDADMFNKLLKVYCKNENDFYPMRPMEGSEENLYCHEDENRVVGNLAALAIAQATNVERLVLQTYYWDVPESFTPPALPFLTEFIVQHGDTELSVHIDNIQGIFEAAPSLKRFHGHMVGAVSDRISHDGVTDVNFTYSVLDDSSFRAIFQGFPKLQKFGFTAGGSTVSYDRPATPRVIAELLRLRKDTLQHLTLHLVCACEALDGIFDGSEAMTSLAYMEVLESLDLHTCALDDEEPIGPLLVNLLPPSIRRLTIRSQEEHQHEGLEVLAIAAPEKFPNLKEVRIVGKSGNGVEDTFKASGISFQAIELYVE